MLKLAADRLVVSEIFDSVQGEGPSVGAPSTFLRLGYCNLACRWCDTPYTWDAKRHDLEAELSARGIDDVADDLRARAPRNLVVTGGEPMLQQAALAALAGLLPHSIEVETAGTIAPLPAFAERVRQWNVSPKLASSGNPLAKRRVDGVLRDFAARPEAIFKLVIGDDADFDEARALLEELDVAPSRVWLMPEATSASALAERSRGLVDRCVTHGYHLGTRLHVTLWGDRRGV